MGVLLFWYPSWYPAVPPIGEIDRYQFVWLLGIVPLIMLARYSIHRRFWTATLYDVWFFLFIVLCVLNVDYAPYPSRGLFMVARPLLGMVLVLYLVEVTRVTRSLLPALSIAVGVGLVIGLMAVGTTQWTEKSADFLFIINRLPDLVPLFSFRDFIRGGFNPNEIGGAMAWLIPLFFGLIAYPNKRLALPALVAFSLLLLGLMLGQSRAAIIGVLFALLVVSVTVIPRGRWRMVSASGVMLLALLQAAVLFNLFPAIGEPVDLAEAGLSSRDERTTNQRFDIWESALDMVTDHPLTGVGMSQFRYSLVRNDYPIPNFDYPANPAVTNFQTRLVPHAHNEFVQIATDLGVPGLLVFTMWNLIALVMLVKVGLGGDRLTRLLAVSIAAGLAAHGIYGMGDAIPLWDRFSFLYWLMLGLAAALYLNSRHSADVSSPL
ncbi:MAG: hypothetical protein OHK0046_49370 [Anaerolineae bacterium]